MLNKINFLFVTLFGIGKIKKIPGSFASLATTIFLFFLFHILNISLNIVIICVIIIFFISLYAVNIFIKDLDNKDPKEVVIDEFIGQSIPLTVYFFFRTLSIEEVFFFFGWPFLGWTIISFILFRFFDIVKPFPINIVDKKMKNGLGVMLDDIIAGAYSAITIYIFYALWF